MKRSPAELSRGTPESGSFLLPGILSRSGYFILDDSRTPSWNDSTQWITARGDPGSLDWYFFAYGNDYRHILKGYSLLCRQIPMIPKYVPGSWATDLNHEYLPGTRYTGDRNLQLKFDSESTKHHQALDIVFPTEVPQSWFRRGDGAGNSDFFWSNSPAYLLRMTIPGYGTR